MHQCALEHPTKFAVRNINGTVERGRVLRVVRNESFRADLTYGFLGTKANDIRDAIESSAEKVSVKDTTKDGESSLKYYLTLTANLNKSAPILIKYS